jgi:hypothetical protein
MGRRGRACFCSSCKCGETTITADGTVTWISHTVADGVITRVNNESPCITYYVDSVSGGGAESGTGTELDPWTNLNTVFSDTCIYTICNGGSEGSSGCPMVKVLVKGTIDYAVVGNSGQNYQRKLVIEPWDAETITINVTGTGVTACAVKDCIGCIWKSTDAASTCTGSASYGFYGCSSSIFNACTGTGTGNGTTFYSNGYGFYYCNSSTFDTCTGTGSGDDLGNGYGFARCSSSTFDTCTGTGTGNVTGYSIYFGNGYGFESCSSSTFDTCTGTGTGNDDGWGYGFESCSSSTFDTCTGTGISGSYGYGFSQCSSSDFNACGGVSTTCGFAGCSSGSTFTNCTATPTGSPCDT